MRKQKCISGNAKNTSQGTLVKLSTACSRKSKLCELRSKGSQLEQVDCKAALPMVVEIVPARDLERLRVETLHVLYFPRVSVYPTAKGMLPEMQPPFRGCSHKHLLLFVSLHHQAFYACSGYLLSFAQKHHVNEQKSLKYGQITEDHASYFKGFRLEGWSATESFWTVVWYDQTNYSIAAVFMVDWSQETQEVTVVVQAWSEKGDLMVSMETERER